MLFLHWSDARRGAMPAAPRFLYKYRGSLTMPEGLRRAEDILLRHQLWLADVSKYSDNQDSRIDYRIALRGQSLRRELVSHVRQAAGVTRSQAERMVSDEVVRDPEGLMAKFNADAEQVLRDWGICSLAANACSTQLWDEYGQQGRGVCFQFLPAADSRAFIGIQPINYSDEERVIENLMFGDAVLERRMDLLMTKRTQYAFGEEWRIVSGGTANAAHLFAPAALTGVILGPNAEGSKPTLTHLLKQRQRATGLVPRVYQAMPLEENRMRLVAITL
jgi:hypothetical protein